MTFYVQFFLGSEIMFLIFFPASINFFISSFFNCFVLSFKHKFIFFKIKLYSSSFISLKCFFSFIKSFIILLFFFNSLISFSSILVSIIFDQLLLTFLNLMLFDIRLFLDQKVEQKFSLNKISLKQFLLELKEFFLI